MQLHDHPLMSYRTTHNWPPVWIDKFTENKTLKGERGIRNPAGDDKLYLHITYEN
jgi:hypothetical protein